MKPGMKVRGLTLIELLVAITIIGILATAFTMTALRSWRTQQLREGASQLVADLQRARSAAQRTSRDGVVTLTSTSASAPNGGYSVTTSGTTRASTLANGVRVAPYDGATPSTATFSAPYGELRTESVGGTDVAGRVWVVSSPSLSSPLYIKLVGVTGKVILSATY